LGGLTPNSPALLNLLYCKLSSLQLDDTSAGIYKYLENDLTNINHSQKLEEAYKFALDIVDQIIEKQIELYQKQGKFFSGGYFRKAKCRVDYNLQAGIIDDDSIIQKLLKIL
jgi:hypothetical protein